MENESDEIPASIVNAIPNPSNPTSINIQQLINAGIPDIIRYSGTPHGNLPAYESTSDIDTIAYIPLKHLT
jgi:hypothetical protein